MTEPMAVGLHGVRRGVTLKKGKDQEMQRTLPVVVGCGPVGLAVIVALKGLGCPRVIASDPPK